MVTDNDVVKGMTLERGAEVGGGYVHQSREGHGTERLVFKITRIVTESHWRE